MPLDLTNLEPLHGHTTPDTAYVVDDYPYGFRLRCKIRYWIEEKDRFGNRLMSQTTNPKKTDEPWNKPKASQYADVEVLALNKENGHVETVALRGLGWDTNEEIDRFIEWYGGIDKFTQPQQTWMRLMKKYNDTHPKDALQTITESTTTEKEEPSNIMAQ